MTPEVPTERHRIARFGQRFAALFGLALALSSPVPTSAQGNVAVAMAPAPRASAPARAAGKPPSEQGVRWRDLKTPQQAALKPLERDWPGLDGPQKQKWLQLVARFPKMSAPEQERIQARMADWVKLTPQERGQARLNFEEARQLPSQDRQARWDAYQALPAEQKRQLAARAAPSSVPVAGSTAVTDQARRTGTVEARPDRPDKAARDAALAKSNIVPNPAFANRPRPVSPTLVRAGPGATTTVISKRSTPPSHQQTGLPKIAATSEFVDQNTLLPQRGPQGVPLHSEAASGPPRSPRQ